MVDISIVNGIMNQLITRGAPPCRCSDPFIWDPFGARTILFRTSSVAILDLDIWGEVELLDDHFYSENRMVDRKSDQQWVKQWVIRSVITKWVCLKIGYSQIWRLILGLLLNLSSKIAILGKTGIQTQISIWSTFFAVQGSCCIGPRACRGAWDRSSLKQCSVGPDGYIWLSYDWLG